MARRKRPEVSVRPVKSLEHDPELRQIFMGEGSEELTDELIAELFKRGWSEKDLQAGKVQGARYNRERDSLLFPPVMVDGRSPGALSSRRD